jgi:hypothetical protein
MGPPPTLPHIALACEEIDECVLGHVDDGMVGLSKDDKGVLRACEHCKQGVRDDQGKIRR